MSIRSNLSDVSLESSVMVQGSVQGGVHFVNHRAPRSPTLERIEFELKPPVKIFEGRKDYLELIRDHFQERAIVVLFGLGGTGKSELARKYAQLNRRMYHSVLWLDAVTQDSLASSIRNLYSAVVDDARTGQEKNSSLLMKEICLRLRQQKVLIIIDNAKDLPSIFDYLEACSRFNILITSNAHEWKNDRLSATIKCDELYNFTKDEAQSFIKSTLKLDDSQELDVLELAKTMNYLPLALQQATACIKQYTANFERMGESYTIKDYLDKFHLNPVLIKTDYTNANTKTIFRTFQIAMEQLEQDLNSEYAIKIIDMMAYMSPNSIHTKIFEYFLESQSGVKRTKYQVMSQLKEAISIMIKFSIVKHRPHYLNMHGLVQLVRRAQLKDLQREFDVLKDLLRLLHDIKSLDHVSRTNCELTNVDVTTHIVSTWDFAYKYEDLVEEFLRSSSGNEVLFNHLLDGNKIEMIEKITNVVDISRITKRYYFNVKNINPEIIEIFLRKKLRKRFQADLIEIAAEQHAWGAVSWIIERDVKAKKRKAFKFFRDVGDLIRKPYPRYQGILVGACAEGQLNIIKLLLDNKFADVNYPGETPVHWAACNGHLDVVRYLVEEQNVDVNATDVDGVTALQSATYFGYIDIMEYLIDDRHCDVHAISEGNSLLDIACDDEVVAEFLIGRGVTRTYRN